MSVRITTTAATGETILRVDGRLMSEDVDELAKAHAAAEQPVVLDLSNLQSADPAGVRALMELASQGSELRDASPYVELLLKEKQMDSSGG
jgi:anti-anti-sigma regulatory factor